MILRCIKVNLHKILTGYGFYFCILFTVVLCFSARLYTDFMDGKEYSIFMALLSFDRQYMLSNTDFCSFEVLRKGIGSWLSMFLPLVSAFSFLPIVCDEYETKYVRFEVFRASRFGHRMATFLTACISGGLAVMLGFGLFAGMEYTLFPDISVYDEEMRSMYGQMMLNWYPNLAVTGYLGEILKKLGCMFLYGAVWAAPAAMLTGFVRNKYLVMCIPFFLKYALNQTCSMLQGHAFSENPVINQQVNRVVNILNPDSLPRLFDFREMKMTVLVYNGGFLFFFGILYLILCSRRVDCGD